MGCFRVDEFGENLWMWKLLLSLSSTSSSTSSTSSSSSSSCSSSSSSSRRPIQIIMNRVWSMRFFCCSPFPVIVTTRTTTSGDSYRPSFPTAGKGDKPRYISLDSLPDKIFGNCTIHFPDASCWYFQPRMYLFPFHRSGRSGPWFFRDMKLHIKIHCI